MSDPKIEPWMIAVAEEMEVGAGLHALAAYRRDVAIGKITEIIARRVPRPFERPGESLAASARRHAMRAHGLLFKYWSNALPEGDPTNEAYMQAASAIHDAICLIDGKDEPTAIEPGDVLQSSTGQIWTVVSLRDDGHVNVTKDFYTAHLPKDKLVRVGRARYWPDGSAVEGGGDTDG